MTDPRIAKLRAKAADPASTVEEAKALRAKADELEAKDAARVPDFPPAPRPVVSPWVGKIFDAWMGDVDIVEPRYRYDDEDSDY